MRIKAVAYVGDTVDDRQIPHGIATPPAIKVVWAQCTSTGRPCIYRTSDNLNDESLQLVGGNLQNDTLQDFLAAAAEIGTSNRLNAMGNNFTMVFFLEDASVLYVVSYDGLGVIQNITSCPFQPDIIFTKEEGSTGGCWKSDLMAANQSVDCKGNPTLTDAITGILVNGFSLGTNIIANRLGSKYRAFCLKKKAGFINTFSYLGDGSPQSIPHGLGAAPILSYIQRLKTSEGVWRPDGLAGANSLLPGGSNPNANCIVAMDATNNDIGTNNRVSLAGETYHGFSIADDLGLVGIPGSLAMLGVGN